MKKIISILLLALVLFSCEDALIEQPKSIAVETFYNTESELESAIAAVYSPLRAASVFGSNLISRYETYSGYQNGRGSWAPNSDFQGLNSTNISRTDAAWTSIYNSIRNANLVIMKTPDGEQLANSEKSLFIAEAKYLRAFSYFILVRNWGGVPIRTEENFTEIEVGRSSEDDVYQLIVADLKEAESNLPDVASISGRATKWAAKTMLADVYFYRGMNSEAASKANEVIASNLYSLIQVSTVDDFYKIFGTDVITTSEEIFYIKYIHEDGNNYPMMIHHPGSELCGAGGWYALYSDESNNVMKNWDTNDLRRGLWYNWDIGLGSGTLLSKKFIDPEAPASTSNAVDIPIYRYADVLLMSAEAECRASGTVSVEAMEKLNMVHRRGYGYNPLVSSPVDFNLADYNKDTFADLVVQERCYETATEGKRWLDLKRLGADELKAIIKAETGKDVADKHLLFPIPEGEMSYNSKIDPATDQNPGY